MAMNDGGNSNSWNKTKGGGGTGGGISGSVGGISSLSGGKISSNDSRMRND